MIPTVSQSTLNILPIDWRGFHHEYLQAGEMEVIVVLVRASHTKTMLEIGCRDGRTAAVLLYNVPMIERYIGVDVPMSYRSSLSHQRNEMVYHPGRLAIGDSRFDLIIRDNGSLDLAAHELPECDVVFIDGDHSEAVVMHDSHLAFELVKPGGVIIWHDYFNGGVEVMRTLNRLSDDEGWPIVSVRDTWLAYCKIEGDNDADQAA